MTDICVCVFLACNHFIYWTQKPDGQTEREREAWLQQIHG